MRPGLRVCNQLFTGSSGVVRTAAAAAAAAASPKILFRFGVIADVQYADVDDTSNYTRTKQRCYRRSAQVLRNAITWWNSLQCPPVNFVVNLGDLVDGRNRGLNIQDRAMSKIMSEFDALNCPRVIHMIGNHELYCFTREALSEHRTFPATRKQYSLTRPESLGHDEFPTDDWLVVVLDPYDVSVMREGGGRHGYELFKDAGLDPEGYDLCQSHNPNDIGSKTDFFAGLSGVESRWAPVNGGVGREQLEWLRGHLGEVYYRLAISEGPVIILSHVILHPDATRHRNCRGLLWNYDEVLQAIYEFPCTRLVLCGHIHNEVYHLDDHGKLVQLVVAQVCPSRGAGVHHLTLPSPLESTPDQCAITAEVTTSGDIRIEPRGDISERLLPHQQLR
ncbi:hypothetical protein FOZ63_011194 [Perkinsus olseni]|uniref:Calcineurin-like phosphoesterase domain-containing protein n=1 Tax=Perkinsus olseni TaxID=32597 RepID=A0A7J6QQ99_PEROL|nr:hypothetical protein FOZ62_011260 [Perkinsus olseni]KAF4738731.1 hypothetical protein FOZ63_011194 [Perkinsus olseni]